MPACRCADTIWRTTVFELGRKMASDQSGLAEETPCRDFVCRECASPLVQPLEWEKAEGMWSILVRCPECQHFFRLHLTEEKCVLFQNTLEEAIRDMAEAADMLDRDVFRETCRTFTRALEADLIVPTDF
jgi:hypothetical protein